MSENLLLIVRHFIYLLLSTYKAAAHEVACVASKHVEFPLKIKLLQKK